MNYPVFGSSEEGLFQKPERRLISFFASSLFFEIGIFAQPKEVSRGFQKDLCYRHERVGA